MRVRNYFNANRFYTASEILENVVDESINTENMMNLVKGDESCQGIFLMGQYGI